MTRVLALVIAAVIGGGVLLPLTSARAAVRNPMQTHVIANGIKLTLTVPRHTYLQDELVQLSVHIQNVSARTVELSSNPDFDFCGSPNPAVVVRDENGRWLYPPAVLTPAGFAPPCPHPILFDLAPKQSVTRVLYAVLRGPAVSARELVTGPNIGDVPIETPPIHLNLRPANSPKATLRMIDGRLVAVVGKPRGAHGSLLYQESGKCADPANVWDYVPGWGAADHDRIASPGCNTGLEWHVTAGWVGQPTVSINSPAGATG